VTSAPTSAATAQADNLGLETGGAITSSGGFNNVVDGGNVGNTYASVLTVDGALSSEAAAQIGIPGLLQLGIQHAVNLFGLLENGAAANTFATPLEICLRGTGEVLFVAASDITRTPVRLAAVDRNGYACVLVPSAGLLVMVSTPSGLAPQGSAPPAVPAQADAGFSVFCQVTTTALVNLRRGALQQRSHSGAGAVRHDGDGRGVQSSRLLPRELRRAYRLSVVCVGDAKWDVQLAGG
jgi:hypothetical protein